MADSNISCCPTVDGTLLTYINSSGYFYNIYTGNTELLVTWAGGTVSSTYGKCVLVQTTPNAYGALYDPIECKCCPDGYVYRQFEDMCVNPAMASDRVPTVPCLDCDCVIPDTPDCQTCGSSGVHVTYQWDSIRPCTDCEPHDINNPPGPIQNFLPEQFLDPVTSTFVLRNKNFI